MVKQLSSLYKVLDLKPGVLITFFLIKKPTMTAGWLWHMPKVLGRQTQVDLHEFKASLVYKR